MEDEQVVFDYEMHKGGITIPRSIFKLPADLGSLYCYLVHKATWAPRFDKRITDSLQEGQVVITCSYIANHFGWSVSKVDRLLRRLMNAELTKRERRKKAEEGSLITICNYRHLQTVTNYGRRDSDETATRQRRDSEDNKKLINSRNSETHKTSSAKELWKSLQPLTGKWTKQHDDAVKKWGNDDMFRKCLLLAVARKHGGGPIKSVSYIKKLESEIVSNPEQYTDGYFSFVVNNFVAKKLQEDES